MLGLAHRIDGGVADWIADNVAFLSAMVDRITPATSERERAMVRDRYGIDDLAARRLRELPPVGARGPLHVRDRLRQWQGVESLSLASALWGRFLGGPSDVEDEAAERLIDHAKRGRYDPTGFLQLRTIFGDLADEARFVEPSTAMCAHSGLKGPRRSWRDTSAPDASGQTKRDT